MIGKISHVEAIETLTNYHFKKMEEGVAKLLYSEKINVGSKNLANASFRAQTMLREQTKKPYTHISLNFPIEDKEKLSEEKLIQIGQEFLDKMGYGEQPFMIIEHRDQDHPHIHIITHNVKDDSTSVNQHYEYYRIKNICRKMELEHNLRIVPNLKEDKERKITLNNEQDYKNILARGLKETLVFHPKRKADFKYLLKELHTVECYETKTKNDRKGIAYAIVSADDGRYINGVGTMSLAGSKVGRNYSYNKVMNQLSENYTSAPQRFRYLANFSKRVNNELKGFSSITADDFNKLFNENIQIGKNQYNNDMLTFIDKRGKNIFSESDLKKFINFDLFQDKTKIDIDERKNVFGKEESIKNHIIRETIEAHRRGVTTGLHTSFFLTNVFDNKRTFDFIEESRTYLKYSEFLDDTQKKELNKSIEGLDVSHWSEIFKEEEEKSFEKFKKSIGKLLQENDISIKPVTNEIKSHRKNNPFAVTGSIASNIFLEISKNETELKYVTRLKEVDKIFKQNLISPQEEQKLLKSIIKNISSEDKEAFRITSSLFRTHSEKKDDFKHIKEKIEEYKKSKISERESVKTLTEGELNYIVKTSQKDPLILESLSETFKGKSEIEQLSNFRYRINSNVLFQHGEYFSHEELKGKTKAEYEKIVNCTYVKEVINFAVKEHDSPESYIKILNERGINLSVIEEKVFAQFLNYEEKVLIKDKDYLKPVFENITQEITTDKKEIEFLHSLDNNNLFKAYALSKELPDFISRLENIEEFKEFKKDYEFSQTLNSEIYKLQVEKEFSYRSEILEDISKDIDQYTNDILKSLEEKEENPSYDQKEQRERVEDYVKNISTTEIIKEREFEEKENLRRLVRDTKKLDEQSTMLGLMGIKLSENGLTEKNEKYSVQSNIIIPKEILELEKEPRSKFYSSLLRDEVSQLINNTKEKIANPSKLEMLWEYEQHFGRDAERISTNIINNYIGYYEKEAKTLPEGERCLFLNSKGIEIKKEEDRLVLELLHHNFSRETNIGPSAGEKQKEVFEKYGYLERETFENNIKIHNALAGENYASVAWMLVQNPTEILLTESQIEKHHEKIIEAVKEVEFKQGIEKALYAIQVEKGLSYKSELLEDISKNIGEYAEKIYQTLKEERKEDDDERDITEIKEYLEQISLPEIIKEQETKEHENLKALVASAYKFEEAPTILGLMGFKHTKEGLTEKNEKYKIEDNTIIRADILQLQEQPFFKFHSILLRDEVLQLAQGEKEKIQSPKKLEMLWEFTKFLNKEDSKKLTENVVKNYIKYYEAKAKEIPELERCLYLNSKGIRVVSEEKGTSLQLLHYNIDHRTELNVKINVDQVEVFGEHKYLNTHSFQTQIKIQNNLEDKNYLSVAWELRKNKETPLLLSETEKKLHGEGIQNAINEINEKYPERNEAIALLTSLSNILNDPSKDRYKGIDKKNKGKNKGKGRRL